MEGLNLAVSVSHRTEGKQQQQKKKQLWYEAITMFSTGEVLMHIYWKDLSGKLVHGYSKKVVKKSTEKTYSYMVH